MSKPWRDRTLGEIADGFARHRRYLAVVATVLVVTVYFPGELPVSPGTAGQAAARSSGAAAVSSSTDGRPGRSPAGTARAPGVQTTGEVDSPGDGPLPSGSGSRPGDSSRRAPSGRSPSGELRCGPDQALPDPVLAPTLAEAMAAQEALEAQLGQPAPVNLLSLVAGAADCGYAARSGLTELLVLADVVRLADPVLMRILAPVLDASCRHGRSLAEGMASSGGRSHPALAQALVLCDALGTGHTIEDEMSVLRGA